MRDERSVIYRKDKTIEEELRLLNVVLRDSANSISIEHAHLQMPLVFLVGLQRSGTTLATQVLTHSFKMCYPDNIIARFWGAPFIGVIISRSLRTQLAFDGRSNFNSDYGVTSGPFEPHEFGYFWTRYFTFDPSHQLTSEQLRRVNLANLSRDLRLMEYFGRKPLLFKAVALSLNCDFLADIFPTAKFIYIKRDPLHIAKSTYKARLDRYGNDQAWWSLKPIEYESLFELPPVEQIASQVAFSLRRLQECLSRISNGRKLIISYEDLCSCPRDVMSRVSEFFGESVKQTNYHLPSSFSKSCGSGLNNLITGRLKLLLKDHGVIE